MTAQSKTVIKSYFQTGDKPTESQFGDFIDSYQDTSTSLTNIATAVSAATSAQVIATNGPQDVQILTAAQLRTITDSPALSGNNAFTGTNSFSNTSTFSGAVIVSGATNFRGDVTVSASATFSNAVFVSGAFRLQDSDASNSLIITAASNLTENRTLSLTTGDANLSLDFSGGNATQAQMEAATATNAIVSPGVAKYHPGVAKAWIAFNGTGTIAIIASYNISSITDSGTGLYQINFSTAFSSATAYNMVTGTTDEGQTTASMYRPVFGTKTASTMFLSNAAGGALVDSAFICAAFFGDQ